MAPNSGAEAFTVEPRGDGAALWPLDGQYDGFTGSLQAWANTMAEAGFLVAMVRDTHGTHLEVR